MRFRAKAKAVTAVLLVACVARLVSERNRAQSEDVDNRHSRTISTRTQSDATPHEHTTHQSLSRHDRLSIIAAARRYRTNGRRGLRSERDCSHLVHAIYEQAGLPYSYAPSSEIYDGAEGFERVLKPQPGDLVVWHGHVGIVTKPSRHTFFSFLSSGPGTDDYESPYWKSRGQPRFYRYVK